MARCVLLLLLLPLAAVYGQTYVTAKTVQAASGSRTLSQVHPILNSCVTGNSVAACSTYLAPTSCLGFLGPLGAYGPLGSLGPLQQSNIGSISDYASFLQSSLSSWFSSESSQSGMSVPTSANADGYFQNIAVSQGALSTAGPLGPNGPLGVAYNTMGNINAFAAQLAAQGLFTPLGPLGPLGALGPLGPLGPISLVASGYQRDSMGNYLQGGAVARNVGVGSVTYELFEWYDETFASKMPDNDCSFMVRGEMSSNGDSMSFPFTSKVTQYVTIVVTGEAQLDSFALKLADSNTIAVSDIDSTTDLMNWIQVLVPAGERLTVTVTLTDATMMLMSHPYRLFVVGSTAAHASTTVSGPMIKSFTPSGAGMQAQAEEDTFLQEIIPDRFDSEEDEARWKQ